MELLSLSGGVLRLSTELVRLAIAIKDSHLTRQLSDLIEEVELLRMDVVATEDFFECPPRDMDISSHEKVSFRDCHERAYAHALKSKKLGKQINHTIWKVLGKGHSDSPRWLHVGSCLFRLWMRNPLLTYLNNRLCCQQTRTQNDIQGVQRYYDREIQNNSFERCIDIIRRPNDFANEITANIGSSINKVFSIPQPASRFYSGRADVLEKLQDSLQSCYGDGRPQQRKIIFIVGEGGSGKTQLCSQFAEKNRSCYSAVFWIDASSADETQRTYCNIDGPVSLGLPAEREKLKRSTAAEWLSGYEGPWLLIVDNIQDVNKWRNIVPGGDTGHILITGIRSPDDETAHSIHLARMDVEDAQELLLAATHRMKPWASVDLEWAAAIVGGFREKPLPLTLIQIAATDRCGFCSLREYRLLFSESLKAVDQRVSGLANGQLVDAIAVLEISLTQMKKQVLISSQDAIKLAHVFPFFHSRTVSLETVQKAVVDSHSVKLKTRKNGRNRKTSKRLGDTWIQQRRGSHHEPDSTLESLMASRAKWALMELLEMSFLIHHESNDTYSMHSVTQECIRGGMNPSQQAIWQGIADKGSLPTVPPKSD